MSLRSVSDTEICNWIEEWPIMRMRRLIAMYPDHPHPAAWSFRHAAQSLINTEVSPDKRRVKHAFDMIAKANTVTTLSLDEMERVVQRALDGEFDADLDPKCSR